MTALRPTDEVLAAFRERLLAVDGITVANVAWAGHIFSPTAGTPYYSETYVMGPAIDTTVGLQRWRRVREHYQITVHWPDDQGVLDPLHQCGLIEAAFLSPAVFHLPTAGVPLVVGDVTIGGMRQQPSWLYWPVVISYSYTYVVQAT